MAELQPLGSIECQNQEPDPARYVILPGLELAKAKKKVVLDIHTWIHIRPGPMQSPTSKKHHCK